MYSLVTFSTIPYAEAVNRARRQNRGIALIVGLLVVVLLAWLFAF
jgi:Tfp pilus assembly protein PilX